jgi:hypothetical protein
MSNDNTVMFIPKELKYYSCHRQMLKDIDKKQIGDSDIFTKMSTMKFARNMFRSVFEISVTCIHDLVLFV